MNYKSKIIQNKKLSKVTRTQSLQDVKRSKTDYLSVMRRKELKSSNVRTGSREENTSLQDKQAKVLGTHCYQN